MSAPGRGNLLYFVPAISLELLKSRELAIIVTEGEFKTLALWRLANHEESAPRFLPVGLAGVWNWRGTIGKTTGSDGTRRDEKGVIPDLSRIEWEGRRVTIAFDADADKNLRVAAARAALARELRTRGAEVAFVNWDMRREKGSMTYWRTSDRIRFWSYWIPPISRRRQTETTSTSTRLPD